MPGPRKVASAIPDSAAEVHAHFRVAERFGSRILLPRGVGEQPFSPTGAQASIRVSPQTEIA